jgi:hypothetical protein
MKLPKRKIITPREFNNGTWYTIDPGIHTTVARWINGEFQNVQNYVFKSRLPNKMALEIEYNFSLWNTTGILIESVELRPGSQVSYCAGVAGDLFLLDGIVNMFIYAYRRTDIRKVLPRIWKGQLSDEQLRYILEKKFKYKAKNNHEACAYGIGQFAKGNL